jgi:hypothetical protein
MSPITRPTNSSSRCAVVVVAASLTMFASIGGCNPSGNGSTADVTAPGNDVPVETLYPWGTNREDLENRFGRPKLIWTIEHLPEDEFAAVTMREMVAARKPRPASYQVFTTRKLGSKGYFNDYVFYNVQGRVIYVVRRDAAR